MFCAMFLKFCFLLSLFFGISLCARDEIRMIVDVIKSYEQPTVVVAKVCWKTAEKSDLMAQLMILKKASTVLIVSDHMEIGKFDPKDTIIVTDLNCPDAGEFLQQANVNDMFASPHRWIIIMTNNEFGDIPTELLNLKILVDSEVAVACKIGNDTYKLTLIYRIDSTSEYRKESFGVWNTVEGLQKFEDMSASTAIRRKNLHGKSIAASYVITDNSTRTNIHEYKNVKMDSTARVTFHNILPLYDFMNASKVLLFTNTWGYNINNSWNGMMGDIIHGEAELCGTVSFMRLERVEIIQYMTQPIPIRPKFVFREPPLSFQNNLFLLPFKSAVWMSIGGLIVILIVIIYINAKWETAKDKDILEDPSTLKANISDIGIFIISAVTQQGSNSQLKGSLGRVVTFIMFLIFVFLYTSYSANIVALLQSSSNQIRTLSDLLNSKLELGVEDESYNRYYFPAAKEPVRKAIYENKIAKVGYKPNFMSVEEGVRRLRNKDAPFAFHMNLGIGYKIIEELFHEHEKCGLQEIEYHPNSVPWLCSRKVSPYREIYKIGLARTFEHGLADRVNRIFYVRKPNCISKGGSFASVNMVDFHPVLLLMLYGMVLSVFLLVVEILMYRRQKRLENA